MTTQLYALKDTTPIIDKRLYFASVNGTLCSTSVFECFNVDNTLTHDSFATDFGPLNLSCVYQFCSIVNNLLLSRKIVVYFCGIQPEKLSNAVCLIGSFMIIYLGNTPSHVMDCLKHLGHFFVLFLLLSKQPKNKKKNIGPFLGFCDATGGICRWELSVSACLHAIYKAHVANILNFQTFDVQAYEHYDCLDHGDLNVILPNKLIAFRTPSSQLDQPCSRFHVFVFFF